MVIGITGGIGSGKSTLSRELAKRGYTVYDCDREAKRIIAEDKDVQQQIIDLLGEESFVDGIYNTAYVAKRVFEDSHLLTALNAIVHPAVGLDIMKRKPDFVESAILFESGFDTLCDRIIVVDAPEEIRIARVIARDFHGLNTTANIEKVRARIRTQRHHEGDLTIINDGQHPLSELAEEIIKFIKNDI